MINYPEPKLPPHLRKTYHIVSPIATHYRNASCQEVNCQAYANGWTTIIDLNDPMGPARANYIRLHSGRSFTVKENPTLNSVSFAFNPGQQCFNTHKVSLERPELYLLRGGDHRGNPTGLKRTYSGPEAFVSDVGEHLETLRDFQNRG